MDVNSERMPASKFLTFGSRVGRVFRLALKELRETLRDRRTIATLVLMPLFLYPLLSVVFQRFLLTNLTSTRNEIFRVVVESEQDLQEIVNCLSFGNSLLKQKEHRNRQQHDTNRPATGPPGSSTLRTRSSSSEPEIEFYVEPEFEDGIKQHDYHLGIRILKKKKLDHSPTILSSFHFEFTSVPQSLNSQRALHYVQQRLQMINDVHLRSRLRQLSGKAPEELLQLTYREVASEGGAAMFSLSALVPLILILMTITGAVYPAIDLTAGERERGTLEILIAAPVPRLSLLLAKYIAVLCVAVLTATVNLVSMTITILSVGLGPVLFGDAGLSLKTVVLVFGLMLLFAAFFSAVLLVLTSFARSFKEAQAYLIPLMLVSLAPGVISMIPGMKLNAWLAVTPLVNIVLLARDLFTHSADPILAVFVVTSTAVFAGVALFIAGRIFGTDAILYGSHGSWSDLFRRPQTVTPVASLTTAMLCLGVMFPAFFLLGNMMARLRHMPLEARMVLSSLVTILVFAGIPVACALVSGIRFRDGFRVRAANGRSYAAAVILGLSLWPFAHEVVLLTQKLGLVTLDPQMFEWARELLEAWKQTSPVLILITMAMVPAVFEELYFRGFLLGALQSRMTDIRAIIVSGVLFGLFHFIATDALHLERVAPSTLLGIVLGWVCVRTGSVFPSMLLHAFHNGFLLLVARYEQQLHQWGWGLDEQAHLPVTWLMTAMLTATVGIVLLVFSTHKEAPPPIGSLETTTS